MKDGNLETKDLMIGDWVKLKGYKFVYKVECLFYNAIRIKCLENSLEDLEIDKFEPISLTPEILEKNGFKRSDIFPNKYYCYNLQGIECICLADYRDGCDLDIFREEKSGGDLWKQHLDILYSNNGILLYVHELQHALRLCGLNELADNFKV